MYKFVRFLQMICFAACLSLVVIVVPSVSAATFTVDTLVEGADGECVIDTTLREAIACSNANGVSDTIVFGVAGTITLTSNLNNIGNANGVDIDGNGDITIDGADTYNVSMNGGAVNTTIRGITFNNYTGLEAAIYLGGTNTTFGGSDITDRNIVIDGSMDVRVKGTSVIRNNYVGVQADGVTKNTGGGLLLADLTGSLTIQDNLITGGGGCAINNFRENTASITIIGNILGLTADGSTRFDDYVGICDRDDQTYSGALVIGGDEVSERNVISGFYGNGISIDGTYTGGVQIQGNYIGIKSDGFVAVKNNNYGISNSSNCSGGSGCLIGGSAAWMKNVISGNQQAGIYITDGASGWTIKNNYIGISASGTGAVGNGDGILIIGNSANITIGGTTADARNIISGNTAAGINYSSSGVGNGIKGNYIGTNVTGDAAIPNANVGIAASTSVTIGGTVAGAGNVISGNSNSGISINGVTSVMNIQGNYIGINAAGTGAVANGNGIVASSVTDLIIGGTLAASRNIISGNTTDGIQMWSGTGYVVENNYIGTNVTGLSAIANGRNGVFSSGIINSTMGGSGMTNVISGNAGNGIDISGTCTGTTIFGNYIGLASDGMAALGNLQKGIASTATGLTIGSTTVKNYISSNERGLWLGTNSVTVINNVIGCAIDETTRRPNTGNGIDIPNGNGQIIGGANANEGNLICITGDDRGITVGDLNSKYISIRRNRFLPPLVGGYETIWFAAGANESMVAPVVTYADTSYAYGTTCNNCTVDFVGGTNFETTVADASGNWAMHADLSTEGAGYTTPYFIARNASNSSSKATEQTPITDSTAPTTLVVTSTVGHSTKTAAYTFTGTKEAYSSVERDGSGWIAVDSATAWTYPVTLVDGANIFNICSLDYSSNRSGTGTYTIILDTAVPSVPILLYSASVTTSTTPITVTGEVGTSIYVNGIDSGVDIAGGGSSDVSVSVISGVSNTYLIKLVDAALNESDTATAIVQGQVVGDPVVYGGGGGSYYGTDEDTDADEDEEVSDEEDDDRLAGEEEDVSDEEMHESAPEEDVSDEQLPADEDIADEQSQSYDEEESTEVSYFEDTDEMFGQTEELVNDFDLETDVEDEDNNSVLDLWQNVYFDEGVFDGTADTDGDGLTDSEEYSYGGDPLKSDSDNDGVSDYDEVFSYQTDPNSWDTDGDGLSDDFEIRVYGGGAPKDKNHVEVDADVYAESVDSDSDGMSDYIEAYYGTDPYVADSDGDGMTDTEELFDYDLNPNQADLNVDISALPVKITNVSDEDVFVSSKVVFKGVVAPMSMVLISIMNVDNVVVALLEDEADENGKFALYLDKELEDGEYKMFVSEIDGNGKVSNISGMTTFNIDSTAEGVLVDSVPNGDSFEFITKPGTMIFMTWRSMIFSSVFMADMVTGELIVDAPTDLEAGEHVLYAYPVDKETGVIGETLMVNFSIAESGLADISIMSPQDEVTQTNSSYAWLVAFGLLAVAGIGIFTWRAKKQYKEEKKLIDKL